MDQLKVFLAGLKKYHFWFLSGLVLLGGLVVWQIAAADWNSRYQTQKTALESTLTEVKNVASDAKPHNQKTVEVIQRRHGEQWQEVWTAWNQLFRDQQVKNPWPVQLGDEFLAWIENNKPDDTIPAQLCTVYALFVKQNVPLLRKLVNARMTKAELEMIEAGKLDQAKQPTRPTRRKPGTEETLNPAFDPSMMELVGTVVWNPQDWAKIASRYQMWTETPSSDEVKLAQEDSMGLPGVVADHCPNQRRHEPFQRPDQADHFSGRRLSGRGGLPGRAKPHCSQRLADAVVEQQQQQ